MTAVAIDLQSEGRPVTGEMLVMSSEGDTKYAWDKRNADEVAVARETFDRFKRKGYAAFEQTRAGAQGRRLEEFDPEAEKVIFVPALQGG
jgi:hypothetical protein